MSRTKGKKPWRRANYIDPVIFPDRRTHKKRVTAERKGAKRVCTHPLREARRQRAAE